MNRFIKLFSFLFVMSLSFASVSYANEDTFNVSLGYNSKQRDEVLKLQNFLFDLGYLKVKPTGLYLSLTQKAVSDFQRAEGVVPASGYFGPLTRRAANDRVLSLGNNFSEAEVAIYDVQTSSSNNTASVILSRSKTVTWRTSNYPTDAGVNINLIRKNSTYPQSFSFVRAIAKNSINDGVEVWMPLDGEDTGDLYIEVTCSDTYKYPSGCHLLGAPVKVN